MKASQLVIAETKDSTNSRMVRAGSKTSKGAGVALSRDEMNLAEFPLAVLSTRSNPNIKTLEFKDTQRKPSGEVVERAWIITGADKFGLPTSTDDDVLLGLMRLSMDRGFRDRKVFFTRYELMKILRWSTEGRSYSRLTKSLDRLSGVRVRASNAFYDNSEKAYQTCNFGIIDAYEINDERGKRQLSQLEKTRAQPEKTKAENPSSFFIWSEVLFESFKAGFVKKIDLDLYFGLKSAVSRRIYRYLDKHFYYRSTLERPLLPFAFEKIGISRSYQYVSSVKQQLEPACKELLAVGFISNYEFVGKGATTTIRFSAKNVGMPGNTDTSGRTDVSSAPINGAQSASNSSSMSFAGSSKSMSGEKEPPMFQSLVSRGIAPKQARRLLSGRNDSEYRQIRDIIVYFDHLLKTDDPKVSRNPMGFLYRAVETPYRFVVPKEFRSSTMNAAGQANGTATSPRNPRKRPELKIFTSENSASRPSSSSNKDLESRTKEAAAQHPKHAEYTSFQDQKIAEYRKNASLERVAEIYRSVESKMDCLRGVLDKQSLEAVFERYLREEFTSLARVPSFEDWLSAL